MADDQHDYPFVGRRQMTIRIGLVGAQFIGNLYMHSLRNNREAEVVAVTSPNSAREFAGRWGIERYYADYRAMIADCDLDAVAIAAPNYLHYDICIAAAEAGKHVLCEKPLALSLSEADTMISACHRAGVALMYGENLLFAPMYVRLRELARRGDVGEPFLVKQAQCHGGPYSDWFFDPALSGGGALVDLGCHSIHAICWLFDAWPDAVTATVAQFRHGAKTIVEDHAELTLQFPGGRMGTAEVSWAMPGGLDLLQVFGSDGRLSANLEQGPSIVMYRDPESGPGNRQLETGWQYPGYQEAWQFGFEQELAHFVEVCAGRETLRSPAEDGRRVLEIIFAAYESARLGRRQELPYWSHAQKPFDHWRPELRQGD